MKRPLILHPFLFAAFPVLSLYMVNITEIPFSVVLRPLLAALASAGLLVLLFRPIGKKWRRAALGASLVLLLFFSFGHICRFIWLNSPASLFGQVDVLLALFMAILIVGVWASLRLMKKTKKLTVILNTVSASLIAFTLLTLFSRPVPLQSPVSRDRDHQLVVRPGPNWDGTKPDIYYIILDEYGGEGALRAFHGVDNRPFLDTLRQRGFAVKGGSAANYWKTGLSLSSALNMQYLSEAADLPPTSTSMYPLDDLITNSLVRNFLEDLGYRTVAFSTEYFYTDVDNADIYYDAVHVFTPFELKLLASSMASIWIDALTPVFHRETITQHFEDLGSTPEVEGPKFVFAHLVTPHPPFVFDSDGNPINLAKITDRIESYQIGYGGQLLYTNQMLERAIDKILSNSATPPIIILQGDHGPGRYYFENSSKDTCLRERFPILNAYYLPGKEEAAAAIPDDITPVNTFRVVLNAYFNTRLPLEPNRHFTTAEGYPYQFEDVTGQLNRCPTVDGNTGLPEASK